MNTKQVIRDRLARMRVVMATSKGARALETERSYVGHMRTFLWFCAWHPMVKTAGPEELARLYVESKARGWSEASVRLFRNALVFYYRHVIEKPLGELGDWARGKRPTTQPVWLAHEDMMALLSHLRGLPSLMARVAYGSGARSADLRKMRIKDINFTQKTITFRNGKGAKDRTTFLAESVIPEMKEHFKRMRALWEMDRKNNRPGVEVPSSKFNGADWQWFWVWAADNESTDPRTGIVRRHHIHKSTLGKALAVGVKKWGGNQRVTTHSLRHSFATEMLMSGMPIQELQELLGHEDINTTQRYAHCIPRITARGKSPLDRREAAAAVDAGNVVPFVVAPHQRTG